MGIFTPKHGAAARGGRGLQQWQDRRTKGGSMPWPVPTAPQTCEELGDYPGEGLRLAPGPPLLLVVIGC